MTSLEDKIIKALRTERGKKFAEGWEWKSKDLAIYDSNICFVKSIIDDNLHLISISVSGSTIPKWVHKSECTPLLTEPQMLNAIEKKDIVSCTYYPTEKRINIHHYGFFLNYIGKTRFEAIQKAFLEIVLGVKE